MDYEFYYNWRYAKKHNPTLMSFGHSGGFGHIRSAMQQAVTLGHRKAAEQWFWKLIKQTHQETEADYCEDQTLDESMTYWFKLVRTRKGRKMFPHERHFMRKKENAPPNGIYVWVGAAVWFGLVVIVTLLAQNA